MEQGLQVWNADSVKILDSGDKVMKVLGFASVNTGFEVTKTVTSLRLPEGTPWYMFTNGADEYDRSVSVSMTISPNSAGVLVGYITITVSGSPVQYGGKLYSIVYGIF